MGKTVIERCESFFEKNERWPDFIGMTEKTCDAISESMSTFADETGAEYKLIEIDEDDDFEIPPFEPDELICYPVYFGPVEGRKLAFVTNKFMLYFYVVTELPDQ